MFEDVANQPNVYEDPKNCGLYLPREMSGGLFTGEYLEEARQYYKHTSDQVLQTFALYSPLGNYGAEELWNKLPYARMVGYLQNRKVIGKHEILERVLHYADWDILVDYVDAKLPTPLELFDLLLAEYEDSIALDGESSLLYKTGVALACHPDLPEEYGLIVANSPQEEVLKAVTRNVNLSEEARVLAALNLEIAHVR